MKKLMKGTAIGVLGLGLALGVAAQANAMPTYQPGDYEYDDSCKVCHQTDPNVIPTTPADNSGGSTTPADNGGSTTPTNNGGSTTPVNNGGSTTTTGNSATAITTLPQTGTEGIYLNYLAGAGLLVPGAALLVSRKKKH